MSWAHLAVLGYVLAGIAVARGTAAAMYRLNREMYGDDWGVVTLAGLGWPVTVILGLAYLLVRYILTPLVTPGVMRRDRRAAREREAERLARRQAQDHDLPFPGQGPS